MHMGKFMGPRHAKHHRKFESQGWWGEFTDYSLPGLLIVWAGFLVSVPAGVGFAIGTIGYHNFGIGVSLWDRVFGTYRAADWKPERRARDYPLREFIDIRWR